LELSEAREALLARAQLERAVGNPRGALERLAPLFEEGDDPRVAAIFAGALRERGNAERAGEILDSLRDRDDLGDAEIDVSVERARLERYDGRFVEAEASYERALAGGARLDIALEAARFAIDLGKVEEAAEALAALAADGEGMGPVLALAGAAHALAGELDEAASFLQRAEDSKTAPEALIARERGRIALRRQDADAAAEALAEATEIDARDEEAWLLLITAHGVRGDGDAVQQAVEAVVRRFGGDPVAELARGRNHLYHDRQAEAVESFETAARALAKANAAPRLQAEPLFWLGRVRYDLGELEASIAALERATALDPSHAAAHLLLGNVRFEQEDYEEAALSYEASLRFDRSSTPEAWFYLGDAAQRAGDGERAQEALSTYLESAPEGDFAGDAKKLLAELE
jgi:tetratricopeptide (TPR) repeat protein